MKQLAVLLLCLTVLTDGAILAQDTETVTAENPRLLELGLCDVSFDEFTLSVPCGWADWKNADYPIPYLGVQAYEEMLTSVDPRIVFPQGQSLGALRYITIGPQLQGDQLVVYRVTTITYSEIAEEGASLQDVLANTLGILDFQLLGWVNTNQRSAVVGLTAIESDQGQPRINLALVVVFEEQDKLALVLSGAAPGYFEDLDRLDQTRAIITSLRLNGEEFDESAAEFPEEE